MKRRSRGSRLKGREGERRGRRNRKGRAGKGVGTQWLTSVVAYLSEEAKAGKKTPSTFLR